MKNISFIIILLVFTSCKSKSSATGNNQKEEVQKWSVKMADEVMKQSDSLIHYLNPKTIKWQYDIAFLGQAIDHLGDIDSKYSRYMEDYVNYFVQEDGSVKGYKIEEYNIDRINPAKNIITLYKRTGEEKYRKALYSFVEQMQNHPKTKSGGFWHKKVYPNQMWLDGIYMASPFLAQYAKEFNTPELFDEVCLQIELIYEKTLDEKTGLLYHAYDESREQRWSNKVTGCAPNFWSRSMGWYVMAIVDVLDYLPENHKDRDDLIALLQNSCEALLKVRDKDSGLWYQVLDQGNREGNYLEGSGSAMFCYAFAKGASKGYLDKGYKDMANSVFDSIIKNLISTDENGRIKMKDICGGCGLGGNPYRDGSFEYYISEKRVVNDPKGIAPFILAAIELNK
ncbi:glycoside hydrolase family 88 protein [Labilibaculum sp. K2S]|uniref:glycoside hydrolase family 88/105 protein n=1 Tax=Labilibaculum sp. K2S TaxID=3056386 RepID=UPI0025A37698|nr:glycoside hydrolase family 88 protein [Labilibaculum sp. K2S]MDM8161789.1 glycoside hydrolase family 88 protein [Labilibaculum sp. K2S]